MYVNQDAAFQKKIEQEKSFVSADLGDFAKFLAYTHDDGPDDVEAEPQRHGIRKLKGTPAWALLYPARKGYHAAKFLYQNGVSGVYQKAEHALTHNRYTRRREARKYLTKIMPTEEEKQKQRERVFDADLKISVLVPLYNTPEPFLRDMIASVTGQTYQNWELCLADASDTACGEVEAVVKAYAKEDSRIVYRKLSSNDGIAENTNACIKMSTGTYLALFDHDDVLHPSALYECAKAIEREGADFVYTDEVTFEGEELENILTYHFKPDFSVDNLRGVNYICHLSVFKRSLLDEVGLFRREYDGSQDHDMILRLTDAAGHICHIPKILSFWRSHKMSTSQNLDAKPYAIAAGRNAVREAELRRGYPAKVHSAQICKTHYRMQYETKNPKVSVLIYDTGQGKDKAARTAAGVEKISAYGNRELLYAADMVGFLEAMQKAAGEYILFLAAGVLPVTPSFIEELLMFAQREDVGLCGMQILDRKGLIFSSDIVVGPASNLLALEVNRGVPYDAPGYMGRNYYAHDVSAISGYACMAKKEDFLELWEQGGTRCVFARILEVCFLLRGKNRQVVLNPYALCQAADTEDYAGLPAADAQKLMITYRDQITSGDPFYNKNLSLERYWQKK